MDSGREVNSCNQSVYFCEVSILVLMDSGREVRTWRTLFQSKEVSILVLMDSGREDSKVNYEDKEWEFQSLF